jgi:parallel beta-helix repeat protein
MYRDMVEQRRFEEEAGRAYGMGRIYGFCHLYIGQEAVSTGCAHAMQKGDIMISAYRIHAQALAMGIPAQEVMDELFGRATGNVQGLGGSMHMFDVEKGFWGGWGLVGQQVPMAVGVAFGQKYRNTGAVTVAFFGDGAMNQGAIHESFNMAAIWDIPIVFVVENNGFGIGLANCQNVTISGNFVTACARSGIHVEDDARYITISNNVVTACEHAGIEVQTASGWTMSDITITGNTVSGCCTVPSAGFGLGGIDIAARTTGDDSAAARRIICTGNVSSANNGHGISGFQAYYSSINGNICAFSIAGLKSK